MQQRFFGTDGIRGKFGEPPLDQPTVEALGRAVARTLAPGSAVVIGGDTRESTPQLASWITRGLQQSSERIDPRWGGVLPTPAVAMMVRKSDAELGLVLSASHNPFWDNGIKIFDRDGRKLNDQAEAHVEALLLEELNKPAANSAAPAPAEPSPPTVPQVDPTVALTYCEVLSELFADQLSPLNVVLDTGHGAASVLAEQVFQTAGAHPHLMCAEPNGRNINDQCGSTAPELAAQKVVDSNAELGFAFDGDADRVIVIDEQGRVRDGDEILFLWAKTLHARGELDPPQIVATSMSNLGLEQALKPLGISVERCDVGDRAVTEMMHAKGIRLGGEQSGHIIDAHRATTGDGLLTALAIAQLVRAAQQPLSTLLASFKRFPQRLVNVTVASKPAFDSVPAIAAHAAQIKKELGETGRLVLRYSGTEPLARVMIEAPTADAVDALSEALAATIAQELGTD